MVLLFLKNIFQYQPDFFCFIFRYYHRRTPSDLLIKVGQPRRDTYSPYLENHHAEKLYLHPEYDRNVVNNDIALIKLKEPIHFNDHVRPVCLPNTPDRLPVGTRCTAIGWGKRNETGIKQFSNQQVHSTGPDYFNYIMWFCCSKETSH